MAKCNRKFRKFFIKFFIKEKGADISEDAGLLSFIQE